jgi:Ca2+-binding RTX toxin-like protein
MPLPTNDDQWDLQSGDGDQFDNNLTTGNIYTHITESSAEVKQVNQQLATALLGSAANMNTGYAYDVTRDGSYNGNSVAHAGIDYQASAGRNVSVVVPGNIIHVEPDFKGIGQFVTVQSDDGKQQWIYGHINASKLAGHVNAGDLIGTIKDQGTKSHFHIEVHNPGANGSFTNYIGGIPSQNPSINRDFVLKNSMSPLQAYSEWKNKGNNGGSATSNQPTPGDDIITGNSANNNLTGLGGNDKIYGQDGNDTLYGEAGNDFLNGGNGNDYLDGYASKPNSPDFDTLEGGAGADTFVLGNTSQKMFYLGNGQATINDYDPRYDYIQLSGNPSQYRTPTRQGNDMLIQTTGGDTLAVVKNVTDLSFNVTPSRRDFVFV